VAELHVLRVFCDADGRYGNPLGVFLDGAAVEVPDRQAVAAELGFSETVFVDDRSTGEVRIHTPAQELRFAGHPLVGTAWLLAHAGEPAEILRPPAGEVAVRRDDELTHVAGRPEWAPDFAFLRLGAPAAVDALDGAPEGHDLAACWAFIDEQAGTVRLRVFPTRFGIAEDEATGAAALRLCSLLDRPIDIHQGRGSRIAARPLGGGLGEICGRVVLDETRER
jgi:predicted PhzF superfamily epimerase YddE/YHI9